VRFITDFVKVNFQKIAMILLLSVREIAGCRALMNLYAVLAGHVV